MANGWMNLPISDAQVGPWLNLPLGSSGTVTSIALTAPNIFNVSGSPVTGSGTLALSLSTEPPNTVWAGPPSGGAAQPTFRALVAADMPSAFAATPALSNLSSVAINSDLLYASDGANNLGSASSGRPGTAYIKTAVRINGGASSQIIVGDGVNDPSPSNPSFADSRNTSSGVYFSGTGTMANISINAIKVAMFQDGSGILGHVADSNYTFSLGSATGAFFRNVAQGGGRNDLEIRAVGSGGQTLFYANNVLSAYAQEATFGVQVNLRVAGNIGVGNSASATIGVGTIVKKIEIFDQSGTSLGFIPVYSSIT